MLCSSPRRSSQVTSSGKRSVDWDPAYCLFELEFSLFRSGDTRQM